MSTKTTFKRVALVAVAALGLGVLSVAPSQATVQAHTLTLSSATSTQLTSETSTASAAVATISFLASDLADTTSVTAFLMSAPSGNTAVPVLQVSETTSAVVKDDATGSAMAVGAEETDQVLYISSSANAATAVSAKLKVYMNAPTKVGTYVVKLVPAVTAGGGVINTDGVTLTITVSQNPSTDTVAVSADSILTTATDTTTATDATVRAPKAASTANEVAVIKVTLKNANGTTTTGESYTATIAGPGLLASQPLDNDLSAAAVGRAITAKAGDVVTVYPDGNSGVATITISSAAGKVLATETVTFYGDATAITASPTGATTGSIAKVGANSKLVTFTVTDAAGTTVTTGTYYLVTASSSIISNSYTACNAWNSTNGWTCDVTGVAKGTTTVYVTNRASATDTTTEVKSGTVSIRVGNTTPASVTVTTDKTTYAPGEKATLTVTVKDSDGNAVPSGTYTSIFATGGITSSYALGTGSDTTTATSVDSAVDGVKTFTLYMPQVVSGDITFSWTTGSVTAAANTGLALANQAVKGSVTVNVVNTVADAATDAANEATDAANAATDAALAAADAADAATAAAQDASDAVAALSASVSKLISQLRAQITSLTNLVIKIQKKVKA